MDNSTTETAPMLPLSSLVRKRPLPDLHKPKKCAERFSPHTSMDATILTLTATTPTTLFESGIDC